MRPYVAALLLLLACQPLPLDTGKTVDLDTNEVDTDADSDSSPPDTPPTTPFISIQPPLPTAADDLVARIDVAAHDPDGNPITYQYRWFRDGTEVDVAGADTVSAALTARGEVWGLEVITDDGTSLSAPATAEATILNAKPTITGVHLDPLYPTSIDDITLVPEGWVDADGDPEGYEVRWYINGSVAPTGDTTLTSDYFERSDSIYATATPTDGLDKGYLRATTPVTIGNGPPTFTDAWIEPETADSNTDLTAFASGWYDADGDLSAFHYQWRVNGTDIGGATTSTLSSTNYVRDDEVTCLVTAYDQRDEGTSIEAGPIAIANTPPSAVGVGFDPSSPLGSDDLLAVVFGWFDADGDPPLYTYKWEVNGAKVNGEKGATLAATHFDRDDLVTVTATPEDDVSSGDPVSASVSIGNALPSVTSVTISPWSLGNGPLSAVAAGWSDGDGDAEGYLYHWSVNGTTVSTEAVLADTLFTRADTVVVSITAWDGIDEGNTVSSDPLFDVGGPSWVSSDPEDGADHPRDAPITWTFDEPIALDSVTATSVSVEGLPGTHDVVDATVTFTPDDLLTCGDHTATITSEVTDLAGNALVNPGALTFTSVPSLVWPTLTDVPGTEVDDPIVYDTMDWPYGLTEADVADVVAWYRAGSAAGLADDTFKSFGGSGTLDNETLPQVHLLPKEEPAGNLDVFDLWDDGVVDEGVTLALRSQSLGDDGRTFLSTLPSYAYLVRDQDPDVYRYGFEHGVILVYPGMLSYSSSGDDLIPWLSPYYLLAEGLSGSEGQVLTALAMIGASVHPELKARLKAEGLWAATVYWLLKSELGDGPLSPEAHLPAYLPDDVHAATAAAVAAAHALDHVPAVPKLSASATGGSMHSASSWAWFGRVSDTDGPVVLDLDLSDSAVDTDGCIQGYAWEPLRGADGVTVELLDASAATARVTVPWEASGVRTDVVFSVSDGSSWGYFGYLSIEHE